MNPSPALTHSPPGQVALDFSGCIPYAPYLVPKGCGVLGGSAW